MPKSASLLIAMALCVSGCSGAASPSPVPSPLPAPGPLAPSPPSIYAGQFQGRTSQGGLFRLKVSPAQQVVVMTVEHRLPGLGCTGSISFTGFSANIELPDRGDPSGNGSSGNPHFAFADGLPDKTNYVEVTGGFTSSETAIGTATFTKFHGCGDGTMRWAAVKLPASGP